MIKTSGRNPLKATRPKWLALSKWVPAPLLLATRRTLANRRGAIAPIYALVFVTMMMALGAGIDISNGLQIKYQLDLAADAASVACGETWQNYMDAGTGQVTDETELNNLLGNAEAAATTAGQNAFQAQAGLLGVTGPTYPSVTNPTILVNTAQGFASPHVVPAVGAATPNIMNCAVTYQAESLNYLMQIAGFRDLPVQGQSTTNVVLSPYINIYLVLDTSASMMVGSTLTDQQKIANWVAQQAPGVIFSTDGGDSSPCAFACHEEPNGSVFQVADMQQGLTNAHTAGATTRFDVMRLALNNDPQAEFCSNSKNGTDVICGTTATSADCHGSSPSNPEGLLAHIRDCFPTSSRVSLNTVNYALYGFNEGINGNYAPAGIFDASPGYTDYSQLVVTPTTSLQNIAAGVNQMTIGLNTHLMPPGKAYSLTSNSVLQDLVDLFSAKGPYNGGKVGPYATVSTSLPGTTANNPLKFVILVTDGMSSDRNWDWCAPPGGSNCNFDGWPTGSNTISTKSSVVCPNWASSPSFEGTTLFNGSECNSSAYEPSWWTGGGTTWSPGTNVSYTYASPIDIDGTTAWTQGTGTYAGMSFCSQLKATGIVTVGGVTANAVTVAVLETPYVPMNGQDPTIHPFEGGVQQAIYPNGFSTTSALSSALKACATQSSQQTYYFQASADTAIASGFITLFDGFVAEYVHLTQ
jgi:hypothetical protein